MEKRMKMSMRLIIVLLASFVSFGFVSADSSSSEIEFNIAGCNFQFDELFVGVAVGECSIGEAYGGWFYCNEDKGGYITTAEEGNMGCSWGEDSYELGTGQGACCPAEFPSCVEIEDGLFQCQQRSISCETTLNADDCASADGYFYEGECVCARTEKSCDIYTDSVACGNDVMNIGSMGVGRSEYCGGWLSCGGIDFSIPASSCGCFWNPDASGGAGSCEHSISAEEFIPESISSVIKFTCSSSYNLDEECIDGKRNYFWESTFLDLSDGGAAPIPDECLSLLGCNGGSGETSCGSTAVKLPGFSLFALFLSLFAIGIYYFVSGKFKYKKRFVL